QLFNVREDPTETENVAAVFPAKVQELAAAWETAAWANTVFPLDDGSGPLWANRRPGDAEGVRPLRLLPGAPTLDGYRSSKLIALRSFAVAVRLTQRAGDQGVLVAHGDQGGGYSLCVEVGHLWFAYNEYGDLKELDGGALAPGAHVVHLVAQAAEHFR